MSSLVEQLQADALNLSMPVVNLLLKAKALATKLEIEDLLKWANLELSGYAQTDEIPPYRMIDGEFKGWNPYHGWQPILFPKTMKVPAKRGVTSSIAELENYSPQAGERVAITLTPEEKARLVEAVGAEVAWLANPNSLHSIPDKVRDIILEWSLRLEQLDIKREGLRANYLLDKRRHAEEMATKNRAKQETAASLDSTRALSILRRLHEKGTALMANRPLQKNDVDAWAATSREMLIKAFGSDSHNVNDFTQVAFYRVPGVDSPSAWEEVWAENLSGQLSVIGSCIEQLDLIGANEDTTPISTTPPVGDRVFIGHGSDPTWREVKDFLVDRMKLKYEEFNREATPGIPTAERLQNMLSESAFALIVMTGEDEHADGKRHPRENVIHELGLFQGHLGFRRAIILLEEGCEEFSNIEGITQIRFKKGQVSATFENIRRTVERERPDLLRN